MMTCDGVSYVPPTPIRTQCDHRTLEITEESWAQLVQDVLDERKERNRIAKECAEATQERDRLAALVARMRPVVTAALERDAADELADDPDITNRFVMDELADAEQTLRNACAAWHDAVARDIREGRAPLDVA